MKKPFLALVSLLLCLHVAVADSITLLWDASAGAIVYTLYASTGGGPFVYVANTTVPSITTQTGVVTSYRVTAVGSTGESAPSNVLTYTPGSIPQPPPAPTNLRAMAISATRIDIQWTPSTDPSVTYVLIDRDGNAIATIPGTESSFINTGLRKGRSYRYAIRAKNSAGLVSGYSNTAIATTFRH